MTGLKMTEVEFVVLICKENKQGNAIKELWSGRASDG